MTEKESKVKIRQKAVNHLYSEVRTDKNEKLYSLRII